MNVADAIAPNAMATYEVDGAMIEHDRAVRLALEHLRRKHPRITLVPFGSAAWGETTRMKGSAWASDIEIGIVGPMRYRLIARRSSAWLSAVLDRDVEVFWIRPARLRKGTRRNFGPAFPNLHAFNLARSEVLGALPRGARPVRVWDAADLPRSEGLVLILNRLGESMTRGVESEYGDAKVAMSCGDALLITRSAYETTYAERYRALRRVLESEPDLLGPATAAVAETILWGYRYKVDDAAFRARPDAGELRDAVLATVAHITGSGGAPLEVVEEVRRQLAAAIGKRVSPIRTAIRGAYSVFRGRAHVEPRLGLRLIAREPIEIRVYGALLAAYLGYGDAARLEATIHRLGDPPADDAALRATLVRLWRAYCY